MLLNDAISLQSNCDGFVKNPFSALRCILRHCDVAITTSLSSGLACLETEAFYFAVQILTFYVFINFNYVKIRLIVTR